MSGGALLKPEFNFYVLRDIKVGEELFVCYNISFLDRAARQAKLDYMGFTCQCPNYEDTETGHELEAK